MTRDEIVSVMRAHCRAVGTRDMLAHCSCGWESNSEQTMRPWAQHQYHVADVIAAVMEADDAERPEYRPDAYNPPAPVLDWFDN